MSYNRLDDLFRKKLKEREFTPGDSSWGAMEQMLDKGGAKGGAWRWSLLGLLLLLGAGYWYSQASLVPLQSYTERAEIGISAQQASVTAEQFKPAAQSELERKELLEDIRPSKQEMNSPSKRDATGSLKSREANLNAGTDEVSNSTTTHLDSRATKVGAGYEKPTETVNTVGTNLNRSAANSEAGVNELGFEPNEAGLDRSTGMEPTTVVLEPESPSENLTRSSGAKQSKASDKRQSVASLNSPSTVNSLSEELDSGDGQSAATALNLINTSPDLLGIRGVDVPDQEEDRVLETALDSLPPSLRYVKDNKQWMFAIEPYYSFDRVSKSLNASDAEWDPSIRYRDQNESPIWSKSYGIDLITRRGRIGVNTGFSFVELGEEVEYQNVLSDSIVYEQFEFYEFLDTTFVEYILDTNMVIIDSIITTEVYDSLLITVVDSTVFTTSDGRSQSNGITSFTYIEVPFSLSYGFDVKRWRFEPSVGLSFGFLRGYSGTYLGKNEELVEIGSPELVLRKTTTSMLYGLGVGYDFTDHLSLWIAAKGKQNLGTVFEEKVIDQRYTSRSVRFGIRYSF